MSDSITCFSRRSLCLAGLLSVIAPGVLSAPVNYSERVDVKRWARRVAKAEKINAAWILKTLSKAKYVETSARIMNQPRLTAGGKPDDWIAHRQMFLNAARLDSGLAFVKQHRKTILAVQKRYRVPGAVIVAILGVETIFGKRQGDYRVLDTLATLSFDHQRRSEFFRKELIAYLKLCRRTKTDPTYYKGSFAGAVGMCQFMPSNIGLYGVDFDRNGRIDLNRSVPDALASVANYLAKHGWNSKLPIGWQCQATSALYTKLKAGGGKPHTTIAKAVADGVKPLEPIEVPGKTPAMLIHLPSPKGDQWRLGTENFAVIMRYNRSYFYAETVRELAMMFIDADPALAGDMVRTSNRAKEPLAKGQEKARGQRIEGQSVRLTAEEKSQAVSHKRVQETTHQTNAARVPQANVIRESQTPILSDAQQSAGTIPQSPAGTLPKSAPAPTDAAKPAAKIVEKVRILEPTLPEPDFGRGALPVAEDSANGAAVFAIPDMTQDITATPPANAPQDWNDVLVTPAVKPSIFDR